MNSSEKIKVSLNRIIMDRALYSRYNCSLSNILLQVWSYICGHKDEEEMKKRLIEELEEMCGTCSSGFASRLVNVISGFGDFSMRISWRDQITGNLTGRINKRIQDMDDLSLQEKVMNEMTLETTEYEKRKHFLKFLRQEVFVLREELYHEFKEYITAILIGLPTWFVIGVLINYSNKFASSLYGINLIDSGRSIMLAYIGIASGDLLIGYVSQYFKSRKKALMLFYILSIIGMILFFSPFNNNDSRMYLICAFLGFSTGYWAIFNQMAAEQFGTNLRATAATTIPNMVRGALPLINFLFLDILQKKLGWDIVQSGMFTGAIVMVITLIAYFFTEETYHKDLDYMEHDNPLP
jgi:hypothetical protein